MWGVSGGSFCASSSHGGGRTSALDWHLWKSLLMCLMMPLVSFWLLSNIWMLIIDNVAVSLEGKALEGSAHFTLFSLSDVFTCSSQLYFVDRCKYYFWEGQTGRKENSDTCLSFVIKNKKCCKGYKKCGSAALIWILDNYSGINFPEHQRVWFNFKTLKVIFTFWKKNFKIQRKRQCDIKCVWKPKE